LGFIYKIKSVLKPLEEYKKGIIENVLVLELVDKLQSDEKFLNKKIAESLSQNRIEFDNPEKIKNAKTNPLLVEFLGKEAIKDLSDKK